MIHSVRGLRGQAQDPEGHEGEAADLAGQRQRAGGQGLTERSGTKANCHERLGDGQGG